MWILDGKKSLRLLVETAKHVNVHSYETVPEVPYGMADFVVVDVSIFIMAYTEPFYPIPWLSRIHFETFLGIPPCGFLLRRCLLVVIALLFIEPFLSLRDLADLAISCIMRMKFDLISWFGWTCNFRIYEKLGKHFIVFTQHTIFVAWECSPLPMSVNILLPSWQDR